MMHVASHQPIAGAAPCAALVNDAPLSPAGMASYLRRTNGPAALCFAQAIYEDAAWANDAWGAYWADVVRRV